MLVFTGMFAAVLIVVGVTVQMGISRTAERSVVRDLDGGVTVFDRLWTLRSGQLRQAAGIMALDYGFRAAVATGDTATTLSALDNLRMRIGIATAFLLTVNGEVAGLDPARAAPVATLADRLEEGQSEGIMRIGGDLYQAVAMPVRAPTLISWTVFGVRLDAAAMRSLSQLSAIPVDGLAVRIATSIGIAVAPGDGNDATVLLKNADLALHRARTAGRGGGRSIISRRGWMPPRRRAAIWKRICGRRCRTGRSSCINSRWAHG